MTLREWINPDGDWRIVVLEWSLYGVALCVAIYFAAAVFQIVQAEGTLNNVDPVNPLSR